MRYDFLVFGGGGDGIGARCCARIPDLGVKLLAILGIEVGLDRLRQIDLLPHQQKTRRYTRARETWCFPFCCSTRLIRYAYQVCLVYSSRDKH